jgi:hypothetical protein
MSTSFSNLIFFPPQFFFIVKTRFPPLPETLYAGRVKLFAEASELFKHAVFELVVCKTASSECVLRGPKSGTSEGAKTGTFGRMRENILPHFGNWYFCAQSGVLSDLMMQEGELIRISD